MKTDIIVENNYSDFDIDLNYWEQEAKELFSKKPDCVFCEFLRRPYQRHRRYQDLVRQCR